MAKIINIIALSVLAGVAAGYGEQNDEQYSKQDLGSDLYGNSEDRPNSHDGDPDEVVTRVKRYDNKRRSDNNVDDIKGALKKIMSGRNIEDLFTFQSDTNTASRAHKRFGQRRGDSEINDDTSNVQEDATNIVYDSDAAVKLNRKLSGKTAGPVERTHIFLLRTGTTKSKEEEEYLQYPIVGIEENGMEITTPDKIRSDNDIDSKTGNAQDRELTKKTEIQSTVPMTEESQKGEHKSDMTVLPKDTKKYTKSTTTHSKHSAKTAAKTQTTETTEWTMIFDTESTAEEEEIEKRVLPLNDPVNQSVNASTSNLPLCYTTSSTTLSTPSTVLTTTTPPPKFDIPALMDIISNFTYDWLQNLTRQVNETLQKKGIPTCPGSTAPTTTLPTTPEVKGNMTETVMAKCFVCGLDEEDIPISAHCADAFAGDFLPLVPVDPKARSKISMYKRYCRYDDVNKHYINPEDPKSIYGRWTDGCAVRWVDLTGIYTQRTCRNRNKPMLGRHFASKRMAMLEMALRNVDDGCIISPAASLLPLSRGISLYARVHVCVCTGNWCNRASVNPPWTASIAIISMYIYSAYGFMIVPIVRVP